MESPSQQRSRTRKIEDKNEEQDLTCVVPYQGYCPNPVYITTMVGTVRERVNTVLRHHPLKTRKVHFTGELWHASAGPLVSIPREGVLVFYFPHGHIEQVEASTNQVAEQHMPVYDLPPKILCRVIDVRLRGG